VTASLLLSLYHCNFFYVVIGRWVYAYEINQGHCSVSNPNNQGQVKDVCHSAYVYASILSGIAQTFALIGAPCFGLLCDYIYRPLVVVLSGVIGMIGFYGVYTSANPLAPSTYVYVSLAGLGYIQIFLNDFREGGMLVSSLSLVTHCPSHIRGSVASYASIFGGIGILLNTKLGGHLFDTWTETAPFFLMGVGHTLITLFACALTIKSIYFDLNSDSGQHLGDLFKKLKGMNS
jgi:MFS family permease